MGQMERSYPERPIPPRAKKKVEADYAALLARRPEYRRLGRSWTSEGVAERARDGNCRNLYFYYVLACQMLHADPRSVHSYLRVGEGTDDGPSMPTREERKTLEIAYVCLLDAFNAANGVFRWHRGDLVKEYKGRFRREFGDKANPKRTQAAHRDAQGAVTTP